DRSRQSRGPWRDADCSARSGVSSRARRGSWCLVENGGTTAAPAPSFPARDPRPPSGCARTTSPAGTGLPRAEALPPRTRSRDRARRGAPEPTPSATVREPWRRGTWLLIRLPVPRRGFTPLLVRPVFAGFSCLLIHVRTDARYSRRPWKNRPGIFRSPSDIQPVTSNWRCRISSRRLKVNDEQDGWASTRGLGRAGGGRTDVDDEPGRERARTDAVHPECRRAPG